LSGGDDMDKQLLEKLKELEEKEIIAESLENQDYVMKYAN
jgi:hypothetical protein